MLTDQHSDAMTTEAEQDDNLVNLDVHRAKQRERFPAVDDLVDRLTDDALSVASGRCVTR